MTIYKIDNERNSPDRWSYRRGPLMGLIVLITFAVAEWTTHGEFSGTFLIFIAMMLSLFAGIFLWLRRRTLAANNDYNTRHHLELDQDHLRLVFSFHDGQVRELQEIAYSAITALALKQQKDGTTRAQLSIHGEVQDLLPMYKDNESLLAELKAKLPNRW